MFRISIMFILIPLSLHASNIGERLKARGVDSLVKIQKNLKIENKSKQEICENVAAAMYGAFATPSLTDLVVRPSGGKDGKAVTYNFMVKGTVANQFAMLSYKYKSLDSKYPEGLFIEKMSDGFRAFVMPDVTNTIVLVSDDPSCTFLFDVQNPLKIEIGK